MDQANQPSNIAQDVLDRNIGLLTRVLDSLCGLLRDAGRQSRRSYSAASHVLAHLERRVEALRLLASTEPEPARAMAEIFAALRLVEDALTTLYPQLQGSSGASPGAAGARTVNGWLKGKFQPPDHTQAIAQDILCVLQTKVQELQSAWQPLLPVPEVVSPMEASRAPSPRLSRISGPNRSNAPASG